MLVRNTVSLPCSEPPNSSLPSQHPQGFWATSKSEDVALRYLLTPGSWDSPLGSWIHPQETGAHPTGAGVHPWGAGIHPRETGAHPPGAGVHPWGAGLEFTFGELGFTPGELDSPLRCWGSPPGELSLPPALGEHHLTDLAFSLPALWQAQQV